MSGYQRCTPENMQQRVDLALVLGWKIKNHGDVKVLSAPKHFACSTYASHIKNYDLKQGKIVIPDFFNDDYIMTTGTWCEEDIDCIREMTITAYVN